MAPKLLGPHPRSWTHETLDPEDGAALGLALLMAAAAWAHLRQGDPLVRALPAVVLAMAALAYAGVTASVT